MIISIQFHVEIEYSDSISLTNTKVLRRRKTFPETLLDIRSSLPEPKSDAHIKSTRF